MEVILPEIKISLFFLRDKLGQIGLSKSGSKEETSIKLYEGLKNKSYTELQKLCYGPIIKSNDNNHSITKSKHICNMMRTLSFYINEFKVLHK